MIVVVGSPIAEQVAGAIGAGGLGARVARAAAASGAAVQIVGRVGEDAAGDQVLLSLAASGVGHVAVLRESGQLTPAASTAPSEPLSPDGPTLADTLLEAGDDPDSTAPSEETAGLSVDAADLELALRYVPDYRVLVLAADLDPRATETVVAAAEWSGAALIALVSESAPTNAFPEPTTVVIRPAADPDGSFAAMVAAYAASIDRGADPADAFAAAQRAGGWAVVAD